MFPSFVPLRRTGPYKQSEVDGFFGKSRNIPELNPENGSYMPRCSPGPCAQYRYHYDEKGQQQSTCERYMEPTRVPQKTNFFNSHSDKNRNSCGYNANPVGLFSSDEPTYYVYWDEPPKAGSTGGKKSTRKQRRKQKRGTRK